MKKRLDKAWARLYRLHSKKQESAILHIAKPWLTVQQSPSIYLINNQTLHWLRLNGKGPATAVQRVRPDATRVRHPFLCKSTEFNATWLVAS